SLPLNSNLTVRRNRLNFIKGKNQSAFLSGRRGVRVFALQQFGGLSTSSSYKTQNRSGQELKTPMKFQGDKNAPLESQRYKITGQIKSFKPIVTLEFSQTAIDPFCIDEIRHSLFGTPLDSLGYQGIVGGFVTVGNFGND